MKAFKGFKRHDDGTLRCIDFQYESGKSYKHEGNIELCESGFHACHELHQVWQFYPNNGNNVFYEVQCGGEIIESNHNDGKFVCSEITLIKEVDTTDVAKFNYAGFFSEGFAVVELNRKWNYINTEGKLLSEQWYDWSYDFNKGFARVILSDKWNYINTEGKLLSEQWFDDAYSFSEDFARVKLNGEWNYIDTSGKLLLEQWYDGAGSFSEGFAIVKLNGKLYRIDKEGKIVE